MSKAVKRERKGDWIVVGGTPGESGHCTRCGEGLSLPMPLNVEVWVAATKAFVKVHSRCQPGKYFEKPPQTPQEWAAGRDTGTSSLTIYSAITGLPSHHGTYNVPHDAADFGRCYRLLRLFPAWKERLGETIKLCAEWKPFVEAWDELTAIYEQELLQATKPRLYARIKELGG